MKEENANKASVKKNPSTSLNKLYITALTAVAVLSILGQVLIQYALNNQSSDSYLLNVSGRQRMLSQRICKLSLLIHKENNKKHIAELDTVVEVWKKFHEGLNNGDPSIHLEGNNSKAVKAIFEKIDPYVLEIYNYARILIKSSRQRQQEDALKIILANEEGYLNGMERVVQQYENEARERVTLLKRIELLLLGLTLCVLFLEGFFIFRPASNKINSTMNDLINAEAKLKIINEELELRIKERTEEISQKNQELEAKNQELGKINKDLDTFVYTASHDLKAPIINIEGLVKVLESEIPESNPTTKELINMMYKSLDKFKSVLYDLADVGKAKAEAQSGASKVSFKEVLEEIKLSMHELIISSEALIMDDFSQASYVKFSSKNLRSILYNLISNSIKFKSPERKPYIVVSTERTDKHILLKVSDNGLGIKQEDISKIFSIYRRLHSDIEGTGVGMSIVKSIIDNYGGKIEVNSEFGKGSVFTIYFKS